MSNEPSKPMSCDGVEIKPGMKVAHRSDSSFEYAGEVLFVWRVRENDNEFDWEVLVKRGQNAEHYPPYLYVTSEEGLRKSQLDDARETVERLEQSLHEAKVRLAGLEEISA